MTRIIFILFCYFCTASYCSEQPDWLTDDESIEFFGTTDAPTYGMVEIDISRRTAESNPEDTWHLTIPFTDGTTKYLNLKKTDGVLANNDTPVWIAYGEPNSDQILYERRYKLQEFGKFTFYQDYDQKASIVISHDQHVVGGCIEHYTLTLLNRGPPRKAGTINTYIIMLGTMFSDIPNSVDFFYWPHGGVRRVPYVATLDSSRDQRPTTVYSQLLIQLDFLDVQDDLPKMIAQTLVYWNAVDMLYSDLNEPRIKINIAGIIIPLTYFTTPWITKSIVPGDDWSINSKIGLNELGLHFARYKHVFPFDEYDIMISFTAKWLNPLMAVVGLSYNNVSCKRREKQVLLLNKFSGYITAAHELAHTFSAMHTEDIPECANIQGIMSQETMGTSENFHWSDCDRRFIQDYFGKSKSRCFHNCPRTKQNCHDAPVSIGFNLLGKWR